LKMMRQEARQIPVTIAVMKVNGVAVRTPIERTRRGERMNDSISWLELAQLTHATQVERFDWCPCEDTDGIETVYPDCPAREEKDE
jgi:hypothetical protein